MADDSEWTELLEACRGTIPEAWSGIGALVQANVGADWQLPPVPRDAAYMSYPIHQGPGGRVVLLKWREEAETLIHSWPDRRVFHCLVKGRIHSRSWQWKNGLLVATGERRVQAPDVLAAMEGDIRSYGCSEGAFTLSIFTAGGETLALHDPEGQQTRVVADGLHPWGEPTDEQVLHTQPWC